MLILFNIIKVIEQRHSGRYTGRQMGRSDDWSDGCATILHDSMPTGTPNDRTTGRQVGRENLEIQTESLKFSTPPSNLKPFSFSPRPRETPPLPKNSVYLTKKDMAKARKDHPKPRSRRSIRRLADMVKINDEKITKFVEEYATRNS